ncbi:MAG: hypothetical protein K0S67_2269 [Nitrososphaeraceae archaeon]|nr:hypothetical protein [Nitrososphaeraceae archaeon]
MTNVNKLNVRSVYAWSIGPNGRHQKYNELVFITEERKTSKARDLYIVEHSNYHKLDTNTNDNDYIYYTRFRFRCKKFS